MKRGLTLLLIVVVIPIAYGNTDWMFKSAQVELTHDVHQQILIDRLSEFTRVASLWANTSLAPRETSRQKLMAQYSIPNSSNMEGGTFNYHWLLPNGNKNISIYSKLQNRLIIKQIKKMIKFPLEPLTKKFDVYVNSHDNITFTTPEVARLASRLAEGESDLYRLVTKIGFWVNSNINYSSAPEVAEDVKSAAWTLSKRYGACDELSGLFIALCRALNIPARYIVGQAYSNIDGKLWQNHGWVEVYFPGSGWIPFDSTFAEFGWVDNSHIEYYDSPRVETSPTILSYEGTDVNISIAPARMETMILSKQGALSPLYNIEVAPFKSTVGLGSFNYIEVTLNNTNNFYVSDVLYLMATTGIKYFDSRKRYVLMEPNQVVKEYFVVQNPSNVSGRYFYTYPIKVTTGRQYNSSSSFEARSSFETFSQQRIEQLVKLFKQSNTEKSYSKEISLDCVDSGGAHYVGNPVSFNCTVENRGNTHLNNLKLCLEGKCQVFNLEIGETKSLKVEQVFNSSGPKDEFFTVDGDATKSLLLTTNIHPLPYLSLSKFVYPDSVKYKDIFNISFLLNNTSGSPVRGVYVNVSHAFFEDSFQLPSFVDSKIIKLSVRAKDLKIGENELTICVSYKDLLDRAYNNSEMIQIRLENLNFVQRAFVWIRGLLQELDNLFV